MYVSRNRQITSPAIFYKTSVYHVAGCPTLPLSINRADPPCNIGYTSSFSNCLIPNSID